MPARSLDDKEPAEQCRAALAAAADPAKLEQAADPLSKALLALNWFEAGKLADAAEARSVLDERIPTADSQQPPLVQHLQLVQGALEHCSDLEPPIESLCGWFAKEPPEALIVFREVTLGSVVIARDCVSKLAGAVQTQAAYDLSYRYFDAARDSRLLDPSAMQDAVFEAVALDLLQPDKQLATTAAQLKAAEEAARAVHPEFLSRSKRVRASLSLTPRLLDTARRAALELAARPDPPRCEDLYYGLGVALDLTAARKCYEQRNPQDDERLLIVMLINGQGGPRNLQAAGKLARRIAYRTGNLRSEWSELVEARLAAPAIEFPEVDFCAAAYMTVDVEHCGQISLTLAEQAARAETDTLRAALNPAAQKALDDLTAHAATARKKDSSRVYRENIDGTARGYFSVSHESALLERQQLRLRHWLGEHAVQPATATDLAHAERALAEALRAHLALGDYRPWPGFPSRTAENINAQSAWLAYRDAWLRLLHALSPSGAPLTLPEVAVRTVLTRDRAEEIKLEDGS